MSDKLDQTEKQRVCCKLCSCEGVDGTMLCREHLEGFQCAVQLLRNTGQPTMKIIGKLLLNAVAQQPKQSVIVVPGGALPR